MENLNNNQMVVGTKTFTEEDVNKIKQSAEDRIRTEYSKKVKELEQELETFKPKKKTEAEIELEERIKALENKEKELQAKELELKVSKTLENNGLPMQLAKYLNTTGVEDVESYLGEIKEVLGKHLINNSYKPKDHNSNKNSITKEQFKKMSLLEKQKLYKENEALYLKLAE
ncbi:DUF4355 domain-containing protein [Clostridium cochlearium]|uniref:capsid assembly scaffolding protein Gp46 family protein n=1 Tax=Clostridium cochlearium TaxID=1494 RepID=UPI001570DD87|nr:DUF4355 domain-containing protein [Clostridium cochlearium]MBV1819038.1 DUF4355 domain-containing protein [Bacteroidales bacterium MSK.15.36]MCG4580637.1 DUF4355 domain-containing protein [Clostridium cochlearium]NSJ91251.1 DUF4355 domain-containing protein [Coprococcus sp. MSK.21.13]